MNLLESIKTTWTKIRHAAKASEPVSPTYSYRIFWVKQALGWSVEERERIRSEVEGIINLDHFEPNDYLRRYRLEAFGGNEHAGASLLVLRDVLTNIEQIEESGGAV